MLRPPSDYESTRIELSNRVAKVEHLHFNSAIIFFTPKVADKGVNLTNLQCTIVQITDRGAWGKEEETFTVDASSFSNRKYRLFDLTTDAEYSLKIIPPPELRMGILEIHFDPDHSNLPSINLPIMGVNNPVIIDTTALAQAMGAQVGAGVQQALANNNLALEAKSSKTEEIKIRPWSGDINNHRILDADLTRLNVHGFHPGKNLSAQNINDVFIAIGTADGRDQNRYDYVMNPGGEYNSDSEKETLPMFAWVAATAPANRITVTRYFSTPPAAPVAPPAPPAPTA